MARGRPRKICERQPNGQPKRDREENRHEILAVGRASRERMVKPGHALDHRAGFSFGRARLHGWISETQYRAGAEFEACWTLWKEVMGLPRHWARTANFDGTVRGFDGDFDPAHAFAIKRRYNRRVDALQSIGWNAYHAVVHIVLEDKSVTDQNIVSLRAGCSLLATLSKAKGGKVLQWHGEGAVPHMSAEFWQSAVAEYEREKAA